VASDRDDGGFFFPREKDLRRGSAGAAEGEEGYCCRPRSVAHREERDANYKIAVKTCVREYNHYKRDVVVASSSSAAAERARELLRAARIRVCAYAREREHHMQVVYSVKYTESRRCNVMRRERGRGDR